MQLATTYLAENANWGPYVEDYHKPEGKWLPWTAKAEETKDGVEWVVLQQTVLKKQVNEETCEGEANMPEVLQMQLCPAAQMEEALESASEEAASTVEVLIDNLSNNVLDMRESDCWQLFDPEWHKGLKDGLLNRDSERIPNLRKHVTALGARYKASHGTLLLPGKPESLRS